MYQNKSLEWQRATMAIQNLLEKEDLDKYTTLGDINIMSEMNANARQSTETEEPMDIAN